MVFLFATHIQLNLETLLHKLFVGAGKKTFLGADAAPALAFRS